MGLTVDLTARIAARFSGSNDFGGPNYAPQMEKILQFANGTGANQADLPFFDERSVAASSNDDIDLAGVLASAFGVTLTFVKIVALFIVNAPKDPAAAANLSNLTIGLGSNPFLGFLGGTLPTLGPLPPGAGAMLFGPGSAGIGTVSAGSSDILRVANGAGGTAVYQIGIIGRSA